MPKSITAKPVRGFVMPDGFLPEPDSIPFPVDGDLVYLPDYDYWDVAMQEWGDLSQASEGEPFLGAFITSLVYVWVPAPQGGMWRPTDGEYVRVLTDPPFNFDAFCEAALIVNPSMSKEEIRGFAPSRSPSTRGLVDNIATMIDRVKLAQSEYDRNKLRLLKSIDLISAMGEVVNNRVGVDVLEAELAKNGLATIRECLDRVQGRAVQTVKMESKTLSVNVSATPEELSQIRDNLIKRLMLSK